MRNHLFHHNESRAPVFVFCLQVEIDQGSPNFLGSRRGFRVPFQGFVQPARFPCARPAKAIFHLRPNKLTEPDGMMLDYRIDLSAK